MIYRFHEYTLDPARRELQHGGQRLAVEPKVLQVLLYLLEHRDRVVPKAELLDQCWPGTFVSESALSRCLARLRKAVQPTPTAPPVLETRHRQGYRFVAEVTVLESPPPVSGDTLLGQEATAPPASSAPLAPAPSAPSGPLLPPLARPASSRCSSATWWIRPPLRAGLTRKTSGTSWRGITPRVRRSSSTTTATWRNTWATGCWSISAGRRPTKTTPGALCMPA